jgi:hypothetical protein
MLQAKLRTKLRAIQDLDSSDKNEMFHLFQRYYSDVSRELFDADLSEKNSVFLVYDFSSPAKKIIGFTTNLVRKQTTPDGKTSTFLFSGDTVLERAYWGKPGLKSPFFWYVLRSKLKSPFRPVYWMLMSKGYKTYLMMRRNFVHSFPNPQKPFPKHLEQVRDAFYTQKFGPAFDPSSGLITFHEPHGAVKHGIAEPTASSLRDADVRFFVEANPNFSRGVELACLAEIRLSTFPFLIQKHLVSPLLRKLMPRQHLPHPIEQAEHSSRTLS